MIVNHFLSSENLIPSAEGCRIVETRKQLPTVEVQLNCQREDWLRNIGCFAPLSVSHIPEYLRCTQSPYSFSELNPELTLTEPGIGTRIWVQGGYHEYLAFCGCHSSLRATADGVNHNAYLTSRRYFGPYSWNIVSLYTSDIVWYTRSNKRLLLRGGRTSFGDNRYDTPHNAEQFHWDGFQWWLPLGYKR